MVQSAVTRGDGADGGIGDQLAVRERAPRLGGDAMTGVELANLGLRQSWVQLDLIDGRDRVRFREQPLPCGRGEVADADTTGQAVASDLLQRPPALDVETT
jgi:hypothetical protein